MSGFGIVLMAPSVLLGSTPVVSFMRRVLPDRPGRDGSGVLILVMVLAALALIGRLLKVI